MSLLCVHVPVRGYLFIAAPGPSATPNMLPEGHCTRLNEPRGHTAAHARTEHNSSREHGLLSQQLGPTHERALHKRGASCNGPLLQPWRAPLVQPEVVAPEASRAVDDEGVVGDRVVAAVRLGVDVVDLPQAQFWWVSFTAGGGKKGGSCYRFGNRNAGGCHVDLRVMAKAKSLAPLRLRPPVLSDKFPYLVGRRAAEGALQRPSKLATSDSFTELQQTCSV